MKILSGVENSEARKEKACPWVVTVARPQGSPAPFAHQLLSELELLPLRPPLQGLAGRTALCASNWEKVVDSQWVLDAIVGYKLDLLAEPRQSHKPVTQVSAAETPQVEEEVRKLIAKGAIIQVPDSDDSFVSLSQIKKDGQFRPVINLKPLNRFVRSQHFKMEGMHVVRDLLQQGDWMTRLDLKDAYFAIPIHRDHRRFLRFKWQAATFEFQCLPFGLSSAPRTFAKILRPVVGVLRRLGIRCVIYLDDLFIMGQDQEETRWQTWAAIDLLEALGFLVNFKKSVVGPAQVIEYLGFLIDSTRKEIRLPAGKVNQIRKEARQLLTQAQLSARTLAKFTGKLSAAILAIHPAPLHYRSLQALKHRAMRQAGYDGMIALSRSAQEDLQWWCNNLTESNGRQTQDPLPDLEIETDASLQGWGAYCAGECTGGCWSEEEKTYHINALELLGATFGIMAFCKHNRVRSVFLLTDNTTVVAHINRMGGKVPISGAVNQESMAMVPRQGRPAECSAFTREEESQSGLPLTSLERSVRLGLGCRAVWDDQQQAGAVGGRPFCNQVFSPPPQVLQLETRSNGRGYRRLGAGLEWIPGICESPLVPGRQDVAEGTGTGSNNCNCGSSLANAGMVSPIEQNAGGFSSAPPTQLRNPNSIPQLRWSDTRQCSTTGRLQDLRQRFQAGGFSEEAVQLILSSWRSKTEANYNSAWRKWQTWCVNRDVNPFDADLRHIVGFLADEFKEGKQYRSLNCYRSAISSTHLPIDGFPVGKHPMVCRLLKGAFNSRPPQPRYTETWDVAKVTRYIQSKGCNADLSLKDISMKLAMLLALTLASRSSDLVRLTVKGV